MDERGAALLEFAIVLPLLFFCIWGMLAFCLHAIEAQMLHFAAFVAARTALLDTAEAGQRQAENFLALSRKEPCWLSSSLRKLSGRDLSVTKNRQRIEVEITRKPNLLHGVSIWLGGQTSLFPKQRVYYTMGRAR